jgi:hypothetical protein
LSVKFFCDQSRQPTLTAETEDIVKIAYRFAGLRHDAKDEECAAELEDDFAILIVDIAGRI